MTITEFREELDRQIATAEKNHQHFRQFNQIVSIRWWWVMLCTLQDIKALAEQLNGEV